MSLVSKAMQRYGFFLNLQTFRGKIFKKVHFFLFLAVFTPLKRVILSETKNLITQTSAFQILHFVQNDTLFFIIPLQNA